MIQLIVFYAKLKLTDAQNA